MADRYKTHRTEVAMTSANTEYSFVLPEGARDWELKIADATVAWRWSTTAGEVSSSSGGHPQVAGSIVGDGDVEHGKQTFYFATSSIIMTAKIVYNYPTVR